MEFISIFDVIGPNMIGPSSSHTAGACSMALLTRRVFGEKPVKVIFTLYGSFADTYKGHGTDKALLGGVMGFEPDDVRIRDAFKIAAETGLDFEFVTDPDTEVDHPNTADILLDNGKGYTLQVRGVSVGGGKIKLTKFNDINVEFTGEYSALIVKQHDVPGVAAHITQCLYEAKVNIAFMHIFREDKGTIAYTVIESDEKIPSSVIELISNDEKILNVKLVQI